MKNAIMSQTVEKRIREHARIIGPILKSKKTGKLIIRNHATTMNNKYNINLDRLVLRLQTQRGFRKREFDSLWAKLEKIGYGERFTELLGNKDTNYFKWNIRFLPVFIKLIRK
jgi:hypothetical protein